MFGSWVVLSPEFLPREQFKGYTYLRCKCEGCGEDFNVNWLNLRKGKTEACTACANKRIREEKLLETWGRLPDETDKVLYERWDAIMRRCYDPKNKQYSNYGGRGIKTHPDFHNFLTFVDYCRDLMERDGIPFPLTKKYSIDRIFNDEGYAPENIQFTTQSRQTRNTRRTAYVMVDDEPMPARDFTELYCKRARPQTVTRWAKEGVSMEEILRRDREDPFVGRRWAGGPAKRSKRVERLMSLCKRTKENRILHLVTKGLTDEEILWRDQHKWSWGRWVSL
jgi:hypothetical protein